MSGTDALERELLALLEADERERIREESESDLVAFIRHFWHVVEPATPLVEGWPLEAMCDALMAVTEGHITRLLINVSPGSMKSLLLNCFYPAWEWQRFPHYRYISASYSVALPERDNRRFARLVTSDLYRACWPKIVLARAGDALVENDQTGWKRVASIGSGTTGHRGDRVLIDDANNPQTTESDDVRETTTRWLREIMPSRLNNLDEGAIISIQQRTHEEDATGVLAKYGRDYSWMCIPARFDPTRMCSLVLRRDDEGRPTDVWVDPRGLDDEGNELEGLGMDARGNVVVRPGSPMALAEGELFWPARFSEAAMDEQESTLGPYGWANQYQQLPGERGGGLIRREWWNVWAGDDFPDFGTVIVSLDTAMEEHEQADYNALTAWGAFPGETGSPQLMLRAAWRKRCKLAELVKLVAETCIKVKADYLLIEHKSRGKDVSDEILRLYGDATWQTVLIKVPGGKGAMDKVARLNAVSHLFSGDARRDPTTDLLVYEGGIVWQPDKEWADEVVAEVTAFPRGKHDDWTDTVSQALSFVRKQGVVLRKAEYDADEAEAKRYRRAPGVPYVIGRGG
jgi:phage terminase large subunit-like protein